MSNQIDELAKDIRSMLRADAMSRAMASLLYGKGWRKQSEGEWLERTELLTWCEDDVEIFYECSCCATKNFGESPYCPNCGAKMKGGVE